MMLKIQTLIARVLLLLKPKYIAANAFEQQLLITILKTWALIVRVLYYCWKNIAVNGFEQQLLP